MAARTSSMVTLGYSSTAWSGLRPAARLSRITETWTRVPAMRGAPLRVSGVATIRSRQSIPRWYGGRRPLRPASQLLGDQQLDHRVVGVGRREVRVDLLDHPEAAVGEHLGQLHRVHPGPQRLG